MKIAVLISGGVDSSVALRLLKEQGHELEAFYLKIWLEDELAYLGQCPWEEDLAYARTVCEHINVPLHVIPLQEEYWQHVVAYTISEVKAGRTPSPDLLCNQRIKFGAFLQKIDSSFDKIATGHYAQIQGPDQAGLYVLKNAQDPVKDQTYFLSYLHQKQLARLIFPIGHLYKSQVRDLAEKFDLPNKSRKDSQGICFLGKIKFSDFIKHHLGDSPGDLIEFETDQKMGQHKGFWYHTIGQRHGLGLSGGPWYVVNKNPEKNIVYISKNYFTTEKPRNIFTASHFNWLRGQRPTERELYVKVRHGESMYACKIDYTNINHAIVRINGQDQGLAPGQFAVFYQGNECLGCAVIEEFVQE